MGFPLLKVAAIVMLLVALLFPFSQTVAPEWTVYTLDAARRPLPDITVREVWQQYSLEDSSHEEDRRTDASGRVQFPRRSRRSSLVQRLLGCIRQVATTGVHASCGANSYLVAFGNGVDTMDWADMGQQSGTTEPRQTSVLVLRQ